MDVSDWLNGLGMGEHAQSFADNEIDAATLSQLTADDLKELGVVKLGQRKRLLAAIAALGQPEASPTPAAAGQRARRYDGDLTAALAPAFRRHRGRVPLAGAQRPGNRCETQFRKRSCSDTPARHTLIFLDMAQNSRESLCQVAEGMGRHPGVVVIWLNLLLPTSEHWMVDVAAADLFGAVIGCRFDGPVHKHVALNVGLAEARGEVVTVCEMTSWPR